MINCDINMSWSLHICRELTQSFIEIVHLCEDTHDDDDDKDIGRRMGELIVSTEGQFQRDAEGLN